MKKTLVLFLQQDLSPNSSIPYPDTLMDIKEFRKIF